MLEDKIPIVKIDTKKGKDKIDFSMDNCKKKHIFTLMNFVFQISEAYGDNEFEFSEFKTELTFKEVFSEEEQEEIMQIEFNPTIKGKQLGCLSWILAEALEQLLKKNKIE